MKKKILAGILVFIGLTCIILFWVKMRLDSLEKDAQQSVELSTEVKSIFKEVHFSEYPIEYSEMDWKKKFLAVEYASNGEYDLLYKGEINRQLGVDKNFPGNNLNGVIVIENSRETVGIYELSQNEAIQYSYILNYVDLNKKVIVKQDTVYGPMPKENKEKYESGFNGFPSEKEVIKAIEKRIN